MKTETKRGHKVLKIIGIILLTLFAVIVIFFIKGKIHERRPWYNDDYESAFLSAPNLFHPKASCNFSRNSSAAGEKA